MRWLPPSPLQMGVPGYSSCWRTPAPQRCILAGDHYITGADGPIFHGLMAAFWHYAEGLVESRQKAPLEDFISDCPCWSSGTSNAAVECALPERLATQPQRGHCGKGTWGET